MGREDRKLLDVSHASKRGSSLRITLPVKVKEKLNVNSGDVVAFYLDGEQVIIEKLG